MKALSLCLAILLSVESTAELVLPRDNFAEGWARSEPLLRFSKNDLYGYIDGGAELFLEFGFSELLVQRYKKGDEEIAVEVYGMDSPEAALGIYLTKCGDETPVRGVSARNFGNRYQFTAVKGSSIVQVNSFSGEETLLPVMVALTEQTLATVPGGNPIALLDCLPKESRVAGSELIIRGPYALQPIFTFGRGDILQLKGEVFGVVGDYKDGKDSIYTRIVIPYPDAQAALSAYKNLVGKLDPLLEVLDKWDDGFIFSDYQDKFGTVEINDQVIEIRLGLSERPVRNVDKK